MKEAVAQYFDAIAIGADSTRAAAAYYLSLTKQCVLLLKQFEARHIERRKMF
jgi:hypothetical protein